MPYYVYKLKDDVGRAIHGVQVANNPADVKRRVSRPNLFFVYAKRISERRLFNKKVKFQTLIMFTNRFATLIDAGVPILTSMTILWKQTEDKNKIFRRTSKQV